MVIGITINNLLRNHIPRLELVYTSMTGQVPVQPINPFDLEASFAPTGTTEIGELVEFCPETKEDLLKDIEFQEYKDDATFDVHELLYQNASFEIFGSADETEPGIIKKISELSKGSEHRIVLTNLESPRSKCATLFFLSKNGFDLDTLYFASTRDDIWERVNVLITDDPKTLQAKPAGKKSIKIKNIFNESIDSDHTINSIKELVDDFENILSQL